MVTNSTSALSANQITNIKKNSGSNTNLGVIPDVSNKTEPALETARPTTQNNLNNQTAKQNPDTNISNPLPNILHQYASYTYGLSLHLLSKDEYNTVIQKQEYVPKRVLIASAGRYNNTPGPTQFIRSPIFNDDFYFENFELDTIVGLNERSRNSNAVQFQFTLIEPYGFTLIERILSVCGDEGVDAKNYLDMPYLIQIDFFGIDNAGVITGIIPNTTKYIPVRINKMEASVTGQGAKYAIIGTPFNHHAFDLSVVTIPETFEIEAETVGQFFQSDEINSQPTNTQGEREEAQGTLWKTSSGQLIGPDGTVQFVGTGTGGLLSRQTLKTLGLRSSLGSALNSCFRARVAANKLEKTDIYKFKFIDCDYIANSTFAEPDTISHKDTRMASDISMTSIKKSNLGIDTNEYDPKRRIFQINAGTYIDRVISWIVRNSKFMLDQINIPDGAVSNPTTGEFSSYLAKQAEIQNKSFTWIKVIPTIKLLEFDRLRNIWSREITYNIVPYEVKNLKLDVGPQGTADTYVKNYNYIYTGQNDDIIDLDIQFNARYYNAITVYRDALTDVVPSNSVREEFNSRNTDEYKTKNPLAEPDPNAVMPLVNLPIVMDTRQRTGSGSYTAKQVALADVEASLSNTSDADMLKVELKIVGDPDFIKQDDIFYPPVPNAQVVENKTSIDPRLTPNGSIKTDHGQVYVNLTFKTPVDIDESTGLLSYKLNGRDTTRTSVFSGIYMITQVKNEFRGGAFIQILTLVRLVRQKSKDTVKNQAPITDERNLVPGNRAILNQYLQAPAYTSADGPKLSLSEDSGLQAAQLSVGTPLEPSLLGPDQLALRGIRQTVPTETINDNNQPQAVVPGPVPRSSTSLLRQEIRSRIRGN